MFHRDAFFFMHVGIYVTGNPSGRQVHRNNPYLIEYPILSKVILSCRFRSHQGYFLTASAYNWNTDQCHRNLYYNNGNPACFPTGQTRSEVTGTNLTALDGGIISCIITYNGVMYTSIPFTIRITG